MNPEQITQVLNRLDSICVMLLVVTFIMVLRSFTGGGKR